MRCAPSRPTCCPRTAARCWKRYAGHPTTSWPPTRADCSPPKATPRAPSPGSPTRGPSPRARSAVAALRARVALDPRGIDRSVVLDRVRAVRHLGPALRRSTPVAAVGALLALTRFHYERDDTALAEVLCRRALHRSRRARQP